MDDLQAIIDDNGAEEPIEVVEEQPIEEAKEEPKEAPQVPLAALHEVRDDNKALKAKIESLESALRPRKEPEPVPDMFEDPAGYDKYINSQVSGVKAEMEQARLNDKLDISERFATKEHGKDAIEAAKEWYAGQSETAQQEIIGQSDPYDYLVAQHQKSLLTEKLTADPEKMKQVLEMLEGKPVEKQAAPQSTINSRSISGREGPSYAGPKSLDELLK
jgi:hypothetical protein